MSNVKKKTIKKEEIAVSEKEVAIESKDIKDTKNSTWRDPFTGKAL